MKKTSKLRQHVHGDAKKGSPRKAARRARAMASSPSAQGQFVKARKAAKAAVVPAPALRLVPARRDLTARGVIVRKQPALPAIKPSAARNRETFALLTFPVVGLLAVCVLVSSLRPPGAHFGGLLSARQPSVVVAALPTVLRPLDQLNVTVSSVIETPELGGVVPWPVALADPLFRSVQSAKPTALSASSALPATIDAAAGSPRMASAVRITAQVAVSQHTDGGAKISAPKALETIDDRARLALLSPEVPAVGASERPLIDPRSVVARDAPGEGPSICSFAPPAQRALPAQQSLTPVAFGSGLAAAVLSQTAELTIYNDTYRHMAYPMGDTPSLYGVCTDVVIRAYRAMGIDLQQRVHESGLGSGDTSIEHRRTETLRRFFARYGEALPITSYGEDYKPGDVITYHRPQNRHSQSHIAMVSEVVGASGRYMIVHNRGWGPQLEDALFVDEITGHYRYTGTPSPTPAVRPVLPDLVADAAGNPRPCRGPLAARLRAGCTQQAAVQVRANGAPVRGLGR